MKVVTKEKKEDSIKSPMSSYFEILRNQEHVPNDEYKIPIKKIRFEDIPKPTNIEPLNETKIEEEVVPSVRKIRTTTKTFRFFR